MLGLDLIEGNKFKDVITHTLLVLWLRVLLLLLVKSLWLDSGGRRR